MMSSFLSRKIVVSLGGFLLTVRVLTSNIAITNNSFWSQHRATKENEPYFSLEALVQTQNSTCAPGLFVVRNTVLGNQLPNVTHPQKIPRTVHFSANTRCMTTPFAKNIDRWRFPNHSVYIHDDAAMDRLFAQDWRDTFPRLHEAIRCLPDGGQSSASKSDVWRYLLLWEYGGLYNDLDNRPGGKYKGVTDDQMAHKDALVTLHKRKEHLVPVQNFMIMSPRHPLMYIALQKTIDRLLAVPNLATQRAWGVTGPKVLMEAFQIFSGSKEENWKPGVTYYLSPEAVARYPFLQGSPNRTVTTLGGNSGQYVLQAAAISSKEREEYYRLSGMWAWQKGNRKNASQNESCASYLSRLD